MTADPITATTETTVEEAGLTMLEHGFRHLPVVEDDRAIGILSIRDVAQSALGGSS
jgi:CBS domain-containing protein